MVFLAMLNPTGARDDKVHTYENVPLYWMMAETCEVPVIIHWRFDLGTIVTLDHILQLEELMGFVPMASVAGSAKSRYRAF